MHTVSDDRSSARLQPHRRDTGNEILQTGACSRLNVCKSFDVLEHHYSPDMIESSILIPNGTTKTSATCNGNAPTATLTVETNSTQRVTDDKDELDSNLQTPLSPQYQEYHLLFPVSNVDSVTAHAGTSSVYDYCNNVYPNGSVHDDDDELKRDSVNEFDDLPRDNDCTDSAPATDDDDYDDRFQDDAVVAANATSWSAEPTYAADVVKLHLQQTGLSCESGPFVFNSDNRYQERTQIAELDDNGNEWREKISGDSGNAPTTPVLTSELQTTSCGNFVGNVDDITLQNRSFVVDRKLIDDLECIMASGDGNQRMSQKSHRRRARCRRQLVYDSPEADDVLRPMSGHVNVRSTASGSVSSLSSSDVSLSDGGNCARTSAPILAHRSDGCRRMTRRNHVTAGPSRGRRLPLASAEVERRRRRGAAPTIGRHCDSSTDQQAWDDFQVAPYTSDCDDTDEEKLDASALVQSDWILPASSLTFAGPTIRRRPADGAGSSNGTNSRFSEKQGRRRVAAPGCIRRDGISCSSTTDWTDGDERQQTWLHGGCGISSSRRRPLVGQASTSDIADGFRTSCRDTMGKPADLTDSDAEDLESLIDDSRKALRLTQDAFNEAIRQFQQQQLLNDLTPDPQLTEETTACRTNVECLETLIDAMKSDAAFACSSSSSSSNVNNNKNGAAVGVENILNDLLMQWRQLEEEIKSMETASSHVSTRCHVANSSDQWSRDEQRTSVDGWSPAASCNDVISVMSAPPTAYSRFRPDRSQTEDSGGDGVGCASCFIDVDGLSANVAPGTESFLYDSESRLLGDTMSVDHQYYWNGFQPTVGDDVELESLRRKRVPMFIDRICSYLPRRACSPSGLLQSILVFVLLLALVSWTVRVIYCHLTGTVPCSTDEGLSVSPRLRYVLGPPPT